MEKIKITVAVITKNEEKHIGACLKSVQWADELIVIDAGSPDRTAEFARSLGGRVIEHPFTGSFADDRNVAMDNARNDWVLHIDADDVVTDGFRQALAETLARREDAAAYKIRWMSEKRPRLKEPFV